MRRLHKKVFIFALSILAIIVFVGIKISAENVKNEKGYTIFYPNSSYPITIPDYQKTSTEFRGVWCSFFAGDISSYSSDEQMKEQLTTVLNMMEDYNMNAIMFHIRTHNDAMYDTELAPQSGYVKGMNYEEFDYLEWFINECHKRGIEFHAWLNPYRLSSSTSLDAVLEKYKNYPNNPAHYAENILINADGEAILDPGRPAVQDYIVEVCMEVIAKYDVDAIHFDDYFYISNVDDSATRKLYNTTSLSIDNFRRKSVDDFIYKLSTSMRDYNLANNRCVQLGISPSGIYRNYGVSTYISPTAYKYDADGSLSYPYGSVTKGYSHYDAPLYCDTKKWIDNEWIDYIIPQVYWSFDTDVACYACVVEWWNACVKNKKVNLYIGTGLYKKGSSSSGTWYTVENEWYNQLRFNQKNLYVDGTCVYQYRSLTRHKNTIGNQKVINECFTNTTKLPVIERYEDQYDTNVKVQDLKLYKTQNNVAITWTKINTAKNYIVYQFNDTLDLYNPEQIVGMCGNDSTKDYCVFNLDYDSTKGTKFAILPITKANTSCKIELITINDASIFDENITDVISFNSYFITGIITGGSRLNLRFYDATVIFGTTPTYEAYYVEGITWDESKKKSLSVTKLSNMNNISFQMPELGMPVIIRIKAMTEFGSTMSEDIKVCIKYEKSNTAFKDVYKYLDSYMNSIYGD